MRSGAAGGRRSIGSGSLGNGIWVPLLCSRQGESGLLARPVNVIRLLLLTGWQYEKTVIIEFSYVLSASIKAKASKNVKSHKLRERTVRNRDTKSIAEA